MIVFVIYKKTINKGVVNKISYKNHIAKLHIGFILIMKYSESVQLGHLQCTMKNSRLLKYRSFYHQILCNIRMLL